jgi:hypothetical protein
MNLERQIGFIVWEEVNSNVGNAVWLACVDNCEWETRQLISIRLTARSNNISRSVRINNKSREL